MKDPKNAPFKRNFLQGLQPEDDRGWLVCLECGLAMRSLPHHLRPSHGLSAAEYRRRYELAPRTRLYTKELRDAKVRRGRQEFPKVADKFLGRNAKTRRTAMARSIRTRRESAHLAGSRIQMREVMARRAEQTRRKAQEGHDERARALGYADAADLFGTNEHKRLREIADMLGVSDSYASQLRRRYGTVQPRRVPVRDPQTDARGYAKRSQRIREANRATWDSRAQGVGYPDLLSFLATTDDLGAARQAALLNVSKGLVYYMRQQLAIDAI